MKSNFEERRQSRIENLKNRSEMKNRTADETFNRASKLASVIPFGQPILVGHHSERGDRNFRNKIHNMQGKAFELYKYSEHLQQRAKSAENNTAIFSDDPEAVSKLKQKIESLEKMQTMMKEANKVFKSKKSEAEKVEILVKLGFKEAQAIELMKPDFCGRIGFPSFKLTNNNATINTAKQRLKLLEKQNNDTTTEQIIKGIRILDNVEDNRIQLFFPDKPSPEIIKSLKSIGMKWSPSVGAWQRQRSPSANYSIKHFLNSYQQ